MREWHERLGTALDASAILPACADLVPQRTRRSARGVAQSLEKRTADYHTSTASMVRRWAAGDGWFRRDRFGRIHTPFTSFPRSLRPLLRSHGRAIIGVDVGAMQMVCAYLLAVWWYRDPSVPERMVRATFPESGNPYARRYWNSLKDRAKVPADVRAFLVSCVSGRIYDPAEWGVEGVTRDRLKRTVLVLVMDRNRRRSPLERTIAGRFPGVFRVLRALKRVTPGHARREGRDYSHETHKRVAHLLQNLESNIMHRVLKIVFKERPDAPVWTRHHAIYTVGEDSRRFLREALSRVFADLGVAPSLKDC